MFHNASGRSAPEGSRDPDAGWRRVGIVLWQGSRRIAHARSRALWLALLLLATVVGLLVLNAAVHYARGVRDLEAHHYSLAAREFSSARILILPYRDARILETQAERAVVDATGAALDKQAQDRLLGEFKTASDRLKAGDAKGVLAALRAIDPVELQTSLAGTGVLRQSAAALQSNITTAARKSAQRMAWDAATRYAAALLILNPSSALAVTLTNEARTGKDLSAKLSKARDAARHGKWRLALRTALAIVAAQKDYPGAAAVVAEARRAIAPKPKPTASTSRPPAQTTGGSTTTTPAQPPPP